MYVRNMLSLDTKKLPSWFSLKIRSWIRLVWMDTPNYDSTIVWPIINIDEVPIACRKAQGWWLRVLLCWPFGRFRELRSSELSGSVRYLRSNGTRVDSESDSASPLAAGAVRVCHGPVSTFCFDLKLGPLLQVITVREIKQSTFSSKCIILYALTVSCNWFRCYRCYRLRLKLCLTISRVRA